MQKDMCFEAEGLETAFRQQRVGRTKQLQQKIEGIRLVCWGIVLLKNSESKLAMAAAALASALLVWLPAWVPLR
jgi:hypothetical protein